jgi:4-alpha-glucanotransferase
LPPIAGVWSGSDLEAQRKLGLPISGEPEQLRAKVAGLLNLGDGAPVADVIENAYRLLAESPSLLLLATLEDAMAVEERPNMPSTTDQWPNWCLALPVGLEALQAGDLPRRIASHLRQATRVEAD